MTLRDILKIARPQEPQPPLRMANRRIKIPGRTVIKKLNLEIDAEIPAKLLLTTAPDGYLRCIGE